ncbi:HAD family hydrolase [Gilvimarinus sp. SDUM040013]|uniref:HAD family hydrolase n=1 Tax=Gilvimarinus gilvus TaxID=3058038 RepID=A0ABU4S4M7_9GAMM|nr:HAD family hydrolase [Gilvimarinus sp. SDUM040013]MDO3384819.1 HAD family hydrolase [Gilvimarinus sp. SDUM040013]MDX6850848.1 HAD family hydrolase [Gilvimarinus sp. SDUM040013]
MQAVLFDLDDTLLDKSSSLMDCAWGFQCKYNACAEPEKFIKAFVRENEVIQPKWAAFRKIAKECALSDSLAEIMHVDFDQNFAQYCKAFPRALDTVRRLSNTGIKLAIVTNGRDFFQRNKIEALGLYGYLDAIVTSGELGVKKPTPEIFLHALDMMGAQAKYSVFCGDSIVADMQPANLLGMTTIWKTQRQSVQPAAVNYRFTHYSEFGSILGQIKFDRA